jgi:hypothetical protein
MLNELENLDRCIDGGALQRDVEYSHVKDIK